MLPRNDLDYKAINLQVERELVQTKRRYQIMGIGTHVIVFVATFLIAGFSGWLSGPAAYIFGAWVFALLCHAAATFTALSSASELRDQLFERAVRDAMVRLAEENAAPESYHTAMNLSDDGELVDLEEDYREKPKRSEM